MSNYKQTDLTAEQAEWLQLHLQEVLRCDYIGLSLFDEYAKLFPKGMVDVTSYLGIKADLNYYYLPWSDEGDVVVYLALYYTGLETGEDWRKWYSSSHGSPVHPRIRILPGKWVFMNAPKNTLNRMSLDDKT